MRKHVSEELSVIQNDDYLKTKVCFLLIVKLEEDKIGPKWPRNKHDKGVQIMFSLCGKGEKKPPVVNVMRPVMCQSTHCFFFICFFIFICNVLQQ